MYKIAFLLVRYIYATLVNKQCIFLAYNYRCSSYFFWEYNYFNNHIFLGVRLRVLSYRPISAFQKLPIWNVIPFNSSSQHIAQILFIINITLPAYGRPPYCYRNSLSFSK